MDISAERVQFLHLSLLCDLFLRNMIVISLEFKTNYGHLPYKGSSMLANYNCPISILSAKLRVYEQNYIRHSASH